MRKLIILLLITILGIAATTTAADGLKCVLSVEQYDTDASRHVLLHRDTTELVRGISAIGMMLSFSIDIEVTNLDSVGADFVVHLVTVGQPADNHSRQFRVEYGLPARMGSIQGKNDTEYRFTIVPLERIEIDTTECGMRHTESDDFRIDPTAHFNIHYVPFTHGDFYWNTVKGLMETEYERFLNLNRYNLPGKYSLYLCPCRIPSVIWDDRFGIMVDPTRSILFSVFNIEGNTTHAFLALYASILRNYGYAPPFLSEGYAGYLSDAPWGMKRLMAQGRDVPLDSLLDTYNYMTADPEVADRTGATFVRYLIEQYKITPFLELYKKADDLNLRQSLEQVYGLSIDDLEKQWRNYVDTVTVRPSQLYSYADQAEVTFQFGLSREYGTDMLKLSTTPFDSSRALSLLVRSSLFLGEYYDAIAYQEQLATGDSVGGMVYMALGSFQMMAGYYDKASEAFQKAKRADSTSQLIDFNIALNHMVAGEFEEARPILQGIVDFPSDVSPRAEARILLAEIMMRSADIAVRSNALAYYDEAIGLLGKTVQTSQPSSQQQLWNGIAHLGLGDTGAALDYLMTARYLESRAFYIGMINLWLGKLADVRGERDVARQYYGMVISQPSADYHQREARLYLESPYRQ